MENLPIEYFDVVSWLQQTGLRYWTSGKNVSEGWVNIRCQWCSDQSNHLGVNLSTKRFNCWKCGKKGTVLGLIMKVEHCDLHTAQKRAAKLSNVLTSTELYTRRSPSLLDSDLSGREAEALLSRIASDDIFDAHAEYLRSRRFDPEVIYRKYGLKSISLAGGKKFSHRIAIPFYAPNGLIMTFTARDVTGLSPIPYRTLRQVPGVPHPKTLLYNTPNARDTAIVVEGPTDVWRIGDGAVCTCGSAYTKAQVERLLYYRRIFIMFDAEEEAQTLARQLAQDLSAVVGEVHNIVLSEGDPGEMLPEDVAALRRQVFGKVY